MLFYSIFSAMYPICIFAWYRRMYVVKAMEQYCSDGAPSPFSVGDRHHHTTMMTSLMEEGGVFDQPPFSNSNRTCSFWIPSLTPGMCMWFCDLPWMALRSRLWIVTPSLPFLAIYQFRRKIIYQKTTSEL